MMAKNLILTFLFSSLFLTVSAKNYYVDAKGSDLNVGTSPSKAWASLTKVNNHHFRAGDVLLFKRGSIFTGQLELKLEGTAAHPILVDAYGEGRKPLINGEGQKLYTLLLQDPTYCTVQNLEVTNMGSERIAKRVGILIRAENSGDRHNVSIKNMTIRDVNGSLVKKDGGGGGIFWTNSGDKVKTRFVGLTIQNCHIIDCGRNGIYSSGYSGRAHWYPSLKVLIKGNILEGVPGDGIVPIACDGAIIEGNVMRNCPDILSPDEAAAGIWPWSCDNTLIQHNEVSGHNAKWDGQGFDSDYNCNNTIIQYNYSHDNAGGFLLVCNDGSSLGKDWNHGTNNTIIRGNVSVNDGLRTYPTKQAGWFSPVIHITGPTENTVFEKNLIVVRKKTASDIDHTIIKMGNWGEKFPNNTTFKGNIFYVEDQGEGSFDLGKATATSFDSNTFIGKLRDKPQDPKTNADIDKLKSFLKSEHIPDSIAQTLVLPQK